MKKCFKFYQWPVNGLINLHRQNLPCVCNSHVHWKYLWQGSDSFSDTLADKRIFNRNTSCWENASSNCLYAFFSFIFFWENTNGLYRCLLVLILHYFVRDRAVGLTFPSLCGAAWHYLPHSTPEIHVSEQRFSRFRAWWWNLFEECLVLWFWLEPIGFIGS